MSRYLAILLFGIMMWMSGYLYARLSNTQPGQQSKGDNNNNNNNNNNNHNNHDKVPRSTKEPTSSSIPVVPPSVSGLVGVTEQQVWDMIASGKIPISNLNSSTFQLIDGNVKKAQQSKTTIRYKDERLLFDQGLTLQKERLLFLLMKAIDTNQLAYPGTFTGAAGNKTNPIPGHYLYDYGYSNLQYDSNAFLTEKAVEGRPEKVYGNTLLDFSFSAEKYRDVYRKAVTSLIPAKWIMDAADYAVAQMNAPDGNFVCLHLRSEEDFARWFHRQPKYYTADHVLRKIVKSTNPSYKNKILYVAGNHMPAVLDIYVKSGLFTHVWTKDDFLPKGHLLRSSDGKPRTIAAILDFEICKRATDFIGNSYSSWSEGVYDMFVYRGLGDKAMMVNDPDVQGNSPVIPFCSANAWARHGINCRYVRWKAPTQAKP